MRLISPGDAGAPVLRLSLRGLSFGESAILGEMMIELSPGETLAITGPSGIGKSTLLRILAGLETGFRGTLERPGRVAMVFQEPMLLRWRRVAENLTITTGVDRARALDALAEVGLAGLENRFPDQLSLGQQRRLALARAFASAPDVLLMDEPFVSLDPALAGEMMALFAQLRSARRLATVLVTHVEEEAARLATRIVRLEGRPARLAEERQNKGAYFQLSASGVTSSRS